MAGRKPGAVILGATSRQILEYLELHPQSFMLTSEIAEACDLRMSQTKNALLRLLKSDRVMHCVTPQGSRWKRITEDDFRGSEQ